jgi:predicted transcriptional regulator
MVSLTPQAILETALWIQLCDRKFLDVDFFPESIRFHLPTLHLLSFYSSVSPGDLLIILSDMENQELIKKEQRVGMWTTPQGNRIVADIIEKKYRKQARSLFGNKMLSLFLERLRNTRPEPVAEKPKEENDARIFVENNRKRISVHQEILNIHICECCRKNFSTNDGRRKYCAECKQFSRYERIIRSRKTRQVNE